MTLGTKVALFADVHGAHQTMGQALDHCRDESVTTIALLGDLIDRTEQADACALVLSGWNVVGVYGNHEREIALAASQLSDILRQDTLELLSGLRERIVVDDVCLTHEVEHWGHHDLLDRILRRDDSNGHHPTVHITFAGHTHFRHARDEHGPIDITRGTLAIKERRRYLINPGALATGQYAIWDRESHLVRFHQIED
jgi:predicted phosphodiesterase